VPSRRPDGRRETSSSWRGLAGGGAAGGNFHSGVR